MVFSRSGINRKRIVPKYDKASLKAQERRGFHVSSSNQCIGCGICIDACPQECIEVVDGVCKVVNEEACIACGDCVEECPMGAIEEIVED